MRYLVAVSGGVDSVVLLNQLVAAGEHELIVAHFDHGIRADSADDARFVEGLCKQYALPFVTCRKELGERASEELARRERYAFLRTMAYEHGAVIVTAHHADDVIETIAINIERGTGWRGMAVMQTANIVRPLLGMSKAEILSYALSHRLEWVEDSTNASDAYLRNRLRRKLATGLSEEKRKLLLSAWRQQQKRKLAIDHEVAALISGDEYSRYFFTTIDDQSARELLRAVIIARMQAGPTRPQLERALLAIKTARPRSTFEVGGGVKLLFDVRSFIVETP
jgi:tRNA(Ile)-lysidine synthase